MIKKALIVSACLIGIGFIAVLLNFSRFAEITATSGIVLGVITLIILGQRESTRCPKCKKTDAWYEVEREQTGEERGVRYEGELGKRSIPTIKYFYNVTYRCKFCEHEVVKKESKTNDIG
jgi:ribosomal protein L37AE/L43A